jgi:hypothetical protein
VDNSGGGKNNGRKKQWAQKTNLKQNVKDAAHIPDIL